MADFKCENCGATEFEIENGMLVCSYCGAQYPMEQGEAKEESAPKEEAVQDITLNLNVETGSSEDGGSDANAYQDHGPTAVPVKSPKSWLATLLLCIFLGPLGIHRFYSGKVGTGIIWLITGGVFGIGWIVDIIIIAMGRFKDKHERLIVNH